MYVHVHPYVHVPVVRWVQWVQVVLASLSCLARQQGPIVNREKLVHRHQLTRQ